MIELRVRNGIRGLQFQFGQDSKKETDMAKKAAGSKGPTLTEIYDKVAGKADTGKTSINVADTKRVLACFFDALEDYSASEAMDLVAKGLKQAQKRRR